jgi:hypothetical protein
VPKAIAALLALLLAGCQNSDASEPSPDAGPQGQGSAPRADVVVNEIQFAPTSGPDWIELANRTDHAIHLSGFFVTDEPDRLDHYYVVPAETSIAANGYLVILADDGAVGEGHHAPFKLQRADGAMLLYPDGLVADAVLFLGLGKDRSLARLPDREGLFFSATSSPAAQNEGTP